MGLRKIVHIDLDAFYASVEQRDNPKLRGRPVAVGHADGRGVVATASYEARKFGVHSAMPSRRAKSLCPDLIFVEGRMQHYKEVSAQVREIFERYTDLIEPISIDEAFLDVTVNKVGMPLAIDIARDIKRAIREELGLVASAGISYNKFLAKVASDWRKPDGLCCIHPDRAIEFIDQLKVEHLWGVGPATAKRMNEYGWTTAKQLRAVPLERLIQIFGKAGLSYYRFVRGIDERPVLVSRQRKSVGCEHTYERDLTEPVARLQKLADVAQDLEHRLARCGFEGMTLTLKVRFHDFKTVTRSQTRKMPWKAKVEIFAAAEELIAGLGVGHRAIRLLGLSVSGPVDRTAQQMQLELVPDALSGDISE